MTRRPGPLALVLVLALLAAACRVPSLEEARQEARPLAQSSFLFAADGSLLTVLSGPEDRVVIPPREIPEVVRDAVVAIEDRRFYQHRGVDLKALLRAAYVDVTRGRVVQGASTITQQYVRNFFPSVGTEETLSRKFQEAALAWQLERELTKEEILARYLNTVYFGEGAYGIQAAARAFFSVEARDLTLAQAALLAGLIRRPLDYNPFTHPRRALARRNLVLDAMLEQGMITPEEHERATLAGLGLDPPAGGRYPAPYFVDYVIGWFLTNPALQRADEALGPPCPTDLPEGVPDRRAACPERWDALFQGGLRIYTTLSPRLQRLAEEAVRSVLVFPSDPYAALTAVDPRTGHVRAMVGGRDYWSRQVPWARLNLATGGSTGRQAGSAFKPFALVAALESGIPPARVYPAPNSLRIRLDGGQVWDVENYEGASYGSLTVEQATVRSVNTVYAQIIMDVGPERVVETAERMGIRCCERTAQPDFPLKPFPSAVLGTNEVNTLEMAVGYGTLATGGYRVMPTPVVRITDARGRVLWEHEPRRRLVVDPAIATVAMGILREVVLYGTGVAANIGRPQFGKTGTAQEWRDAWFVGAVPQLVAAVWVGFPDSQRPMYATRIGRVTGGSWPAQIWRAFMVNAVRPWPPREFPTVVVPYVAVRIDVTQGCLPNPFTPPGNIRTVRYIAGTEPTEVCTEPTEYQLLPVPSVIGLKEVRATQVLQAAGFAVRVEEAASDQPVGTVIAQDPAAGEEALQTSTVRITVSAGPALVTVPQVTGLGASDATAALEAAGFAVKLHVRACDPGDPDCDPTPGTVWAQSPAGGTEAESGSRVVIWANP